MARVTMMALNIEVMIPNDAIRNLIREGHVAHAAYLLRSDKKMYAWGYNYQNSLNTSANLMAECKEVKELSQLEVAQAVARG